MASVDVAVHTDIEDADITTITRRSVSGVAALVSRQFFLNLISIVASFFIFSFLTPAEVGLYTAVIAIQRIISFFTDFGLGAALVQKKEAVTQSEITTIFTIQAGITFSIFLLVLLLGPFLSHFLQNNSQAQILLIVLVFTIFISSFKAIPALLLERKIQFDKLVIPQIAESLVFNILLIILLVGNHGISSYSWAFLVSSVIGLPLYYIVSPWKMRLGIDRKALAHLKFGTQFQAKNILATVKDDFLTVFLAKILGFVELGYIGFAMRIAFLTFRYVVDSVTKVTFSTYARIQHDMQTLRIGIEKSLFFVGIIMCPLLLGTIVVVPYVIEYLPSWNDKWEPAIISVVFFSLNALLSSFSGILVNVLDATGRVKITLRLMVMWTLLTWVLTPLLVFYLGYNGVGLATFLVATTIFITIRLVKQIVAFNFLKNIYKAFIASLIMAACVFVLERTLVSNLSLLIFVILVGAGIYCIVLYAFAKKELTSDIAYILKKYDKK